MGFGCGFAAVRWWLRLLGCVGALACGLSAWGQTGTDGAIGGQVLSAAGLPLAGALVMVRGVETGLVERVRSGARGEFLVVRLSGGRLCGDGGGCGYGAGRFPGR